MPETADYVRSVISEAAAQIDQDMRQPVCALPRMSWSLQKESPQDQSRQEALFQEIQTRLFTDFSQIHVSPEIYHYSIRNFPKSGSTFLSAAECV
jgi:hypothetical protein